MLNTTQIAERVGVSPPAVSQWKRLPDWRWGPGPLYDDAILDEIIQWRATREIKVTDVLRARRKAEASTAGAQSSAPRSDTHAGQRSGPGARDGGNGHAGEHHSSVADEFLALKARKVLADAKFAEAKTARLEGTHISTAYMLQRVARWTKIVRTIFEEAVDRLPAMLEGPASAWLRDEMTVMYEDMLARMADDVEEHHRELAAEDAKKSDAASRKVRMDR